MRQIYAAALCANFRTHQDHLSAQALIVPPQTSKATIYVLTDHTKLKKKLSLRAKVTDTQPVSKHKNNNTKQYNEKFYPNCFCFCAIHAFGAR